MSRIRLSEGQLRRVIKESVRRILREEIDGDDEEYKEGSKVRVDITINSPKDGEYNKSFFIQLKHDANCYSLEDSDFFHSLLKQTLKIVNLQKWQKYLKVVDCDAFSANLKGTDETTGEKIDIRFRFCERRYF